MPKEKTTNRVRKLEKLEKSNCIKTRDKIQIQKAIKTKKGLNSVIITKLLKCSPHFIGCFAEDEVHSLHLGSLPCFMIVNLDSSYMSGSHWIAIGIFKNKIEIFDSLGFDIFNWPRIPCKLMNLLQRAAVFKKVRISKRLQSNSSTLCALYSVFYVLFRPHFSFKLLQNFFSSKLSRNDSRLLKLFVYDFKYFSLRWIMKCLCQMKITQSIIKLQNAIFQEQTMKAVWNLSLKKTQTYFYAKIKFLSKEPLKLIKDIFLRMDLPQNCFRCCR